MRTILARASGIAAVAAAVFLVSAGPASAANTTCRGHTAKAEGTEDAPNRVEYAFGCSGKILGYTVVLDQEVSAFEAEVPVFDTAGAITPQQFGCEGDIPGFGFGCLGAYSAGGRAVKGLFEIAQDPCAEPRINAQLVVVTSDKGAMAGPFDLGRPRGCRKSSRLMGLIKLVERLRAVAAAARKH